jgi:alpha-mannosidase
MFHLIPTTRIPTAGAASPSEAHLTHSSKIFTSVVAALEAYPGRRFTIGSNVALFARWYDEQTHAVKARVKRLVASGALEFVDGGWVNADYSCPTWE